MAKRYAKALALFMVLVMAIGLTGCGTINIIGLAIPTMVELIEGDSAALEVSYSADKDNVSEEALLEAADKLTLEWSSDNEAIVTVDENGNLTAIKGGEATVTVKAGEIFSTCRVTVRVPLKGFEVESEMSLYINGSVEDIVPSKQLVVGPIPANADDYDPVYTSADESIATVDEDGVVTAVSNGKTTITVKSGDIKTEVEVTVYTAPGFIEVEDAELYIGRSGELAVKVDDEDVTFTNPLVYASSDEDICMVDESGTVSGISEGEATITVSNGTGVIGTATITVKPAPVVRPASTGSNAGGTAGNGDSEAASAPASSEPYCTVCQMYGHTGCYHGNGYDAGVCTLCPGGTVYVPYLLSHDELVYYLFGVEGGEGTAWE